MIVIECVLLNVVEFVQALKVHVDEPQPFDGEEKPHASRMEDYNSDVTVAYIKVANGVQEFARVNSTFLRVLWPVMHQAKIATMHDRALLRVAQAKYIGARGEKCIMHWYYNIAGMAKLGVRIGKHKDNNYHFWKHRLYNPQGISRTGDLPWCLALPVFP